MEKCYFVTEVVLNDGFFFVATVFILEGSVQMSGISFTLGRTGLAS